MSKYDIALRWIEDGLLIDPTHEELLKMRQACEKSNVRFSVTMNVYFSKAISFRSGKHHIF